MSAKLVVLISGNGSNLQAILDSCANGDLPAQVVAVISDKPGAFGLVRAQQAGVHTTAIPVKAGEERRLYDGRLAVEVEHWAPDFVVLAGWMRLLSSTFLEQFPGKVINLHPALPGFFPGTHAIKRAYEAWERAEIDHTGVMVHQVPDEGVDDGPVLSTQIINFQPGELYEQFESRVHDIEHALLIRTLRMVIHNIR